jgi:predicted NBD/HSP70 family sugar kinase
MASAGEVLRLIREGTADTRPEIGRLTGLSRTAVAARVDVLLAAGLIREAPLSSGTVGRPAVGFAFNAGAGVVLAAAIGRSRTHLACCDLAGTVLARSELDHADAEIAADPGQFLPEIATALRALHRRVDRGRGRVWAFGVSIPGTVDQRLGASLSSPIMRGWDGVPIPPYFARLADAPVYVENDTNVIGLAELDAHPNLYRDALIVKASSGLGAAIIAGGHLQHGARGAAGEIGHVKYAPARGVACRCGDTGCLESVAAGWALVRDLRENGKQVTHIRDVVTLAIGGDLDARRAIRRSGRAVGDILAGAVTLLNPAVIVIGGDIAPAYDLYVAGLRETLYRGTTALASRDLQIRPAAHAADSGVIGTAAHALGQALDPAAIDLSLASSGGH